jgi:hypothetical protein
MLSFYAEFISASKKYRMIITKSKNSIFLEQQLCYSNQASCCVLQSFNLSRLKTRQVKIFIRAIKKDRYFNDEKRCLNKQRF